MARHNQTGRSKGFGRFVQFPEYIARSYAWSRLAPLAKVAWLEIGLIYNGSNNGCLGVSARVLAARLGVSKSSATRAINELVRWGFLDLMKRSDFGKKKSAAEYRLTHVDCNVTNERPSKRFMKIADVGSAQPQNELLPVGP
ncbi:helix-turn-helix domain-containing protein [Methylocystis echinoides]|uniref:MarR family transcriptional regulator n=1 Tax=Methylocystis echinoides TaxID=29468 RepID=UPI003442BDEC